MTLQDLSASEPPTLDYTDFERELLAAGRSEAPGAELEARMLAPLGGLASGTAGERFVSPENAVPRTGPFGARELALWGAGATGATLLALGLFLGGSSSVDEQPQRATVVAPGRPAAPGQPGEGVAPAEAEPASVDTGLTEAARRGSTSAAGSSPASRTAHSSSAGPPNVDPRRDRTTVAARPSRESSGDTLGEELRLLDAARAALASGAPKEARRLLERYDARFPAGQLHREARVLERRLAATPP